MKPEDITEDHDDQTCSPKELERILKVGRHSVYRGLRDGTIPSIRLGRRYVIPRAAIAEWLKRAGQVK